MKKFIISLVLLFLVLVSFMLVPIHASASEYDLFHTGRVTFDVEVPDGFNNIVFVSLMDSEGGFQQFAVLPESNYRLVEYITCGPYRISGYVDNDPWVEYTVLRGEDTVTVTDKKDLTIQLTVIGGPEGIDPDVTLPTPPSDEIEPSEAPTEPFVTEAETEPVPDTEPHEEPQEPKETAPSDSSDEEGEKPFWQRLLVSAIVSLVFAGIVIGVVAVARKYYE